MTRQWRVFVVEDDDALHRQVMSALRKDGYVVHGATNKREAVRVLWAEEHDAVICDLKSSPSDDIELLQWLRAYRPNARVIFVGGPNVRTFALESGATSYLERPLDLNRLKEELHRLLSQTGFSANLDSFDLLDVIQIVSSSRKNIALLVSTGLEERGMLCFQEGNMVWAEYGMLRGEEAFFALAAHKNGTVIHQHWNQRVTPNVTQPLSRLVLQAFQYRTKYASKQESGELDAIQSAQSGQSGQIARIAGYQEDDAPFLVALEEPSFPEEMTQQTGQQEQYAQMQRKVPYGVHEMTFQSSASEPIEPQKQDAVTNEWWQQTGNQTTQQEMQQAQQEMMATGEAGQVEHQGRTPRPTVPITPNFEKLLQDSNSMRRIPPGMRKTHMRGEQAGLGNQDEYRPNDKLPSWLTDQPTVTRLSAVSDSAHTPKTPMTPVPPTPVLRTTHPLSLSSSAPQVPMTPKITAEWKTPAVSDKKTEQVVQEEKRQETGPQGIAGNRRPSAEWQGVSAASHSGSLPSITASRLANTTAVAASERESARRGSGIAKPRTVKSGYNYAALVSALQDLGYAVPGFIAAAVVTLDGQPVAQVAVDDLDISGLCPNLSQMMLSMLHMLHQDTMGELEHMVMTSSDRYFILRVIRDRKGMQQSSQSDDMAFQVLITTRKADTTGCIALMANVEGAIATALHL